MPILALLITPEFTRLANNQRMSGTIMNVLKADLLGRYGDSDGVDVAVTFRNPSDGRAFVDQFRMSLADLIRVGAAQESWKIDSYGKTDLAAKEEAQALIERSLEKAVAAKRWISEQAEWDAKVSEARAQKAYEDTYGAPMMPKSVTTMAAVRDMYFVATGNRWGSLDGGNIWKVLPNEANKQADCPVSPQEQALSETRPIRKIEV